MKYNFCLDYRKLIRNDLISYQTASLEPEQAPVQAALPLNTSEIPTVQEILDDFNEDDIMHLPSEFLVEREVSLIYSSR